MDVLPGTYNISVQQNSWCWEKQQIELNVEYVDIDQIEFKQSGYLLHTTQSHDLSFRISGPEGYDKVNGVTKGSSKFCLAKAGSYTVKPDNSCYRFGRESYNYDTTSPAVIELNAQAFRVNGTLEVSSSSAASNAASLPVKVVRISSGAVEEVHAQFKSVESRQRGGKAESTLPFPSTAVYMQTPLLIRCAYLCAVSGLRVFQYSFWGVSNEKYSISAAVYPSPNPSERTDILFYPRSREVTVHSKGCASPVDALEGRSGVYLSGTVKPGVSGVTITVTTTAKDGADSSAQPLIQTVITDNHGNYRVGPLYDDQRHSVAASADGYHFKEESPAGNFRALKLGSITITVNDQNSQPLPGVLLSLSGGDGYRRNNQTDANGKFVFTQLFPGDVWHPSRHSSARVVF